MKNQRKKSQIEFRPISGHWIGIPDSYHAQVGDFFVPQFDGTPDGQVCPVQRSLLDTAVVSPTSAGFTFPAAGLLPAMTYAAQQRQVSITPPMSNIPDLPIPVRSLMSQNPVIGELVHGFSAGIIEYGGDLTKAQIVAEICLAFPGRRVLALSPHRHELRRILEVLPRYAPFVGVIDVSRGELPFDIEDVEIADESDEIKGCQLALATPKTAGNLWETTGTDVSDYPIVIVLNAARAKDLMTSAFLMAHRARFRIIGLRHIESNFRGEESDLAQNVFGPIYLRIPGNGIEQSETSYTWLLNRFKLRNLQRRPKPVDVLRLTPYCTQRNNLVADVARCLVEGGRIEDDDLVQHWLQTNHIERPTIAIIARTFAHAARLVQRLPDWHVYLPDTSPELLVGLTTADRKVIRDRSVEHPGSNRIVCPLDYLVPFLEYADPQIIIQASGGLLAPTFPSTWFRHPAGTQRPRLVIDFFDDALPITAQISECRFTGYEPPDFVPVDLEVSRQDLSIGLPLQKFINRRFKPARRRRSSR